MKLKEYLEQEYNKLKEEYKKNKIELEKEYDKVVKEIKETAKQYDINEDSYEYLLKKCGERIGDIWLAKCGVDETIMLTVYKPFNDNYIKKFFTYVYNELCDKQISLKAKLLITKEILDNKEQYITINKKQLNDFAKYKNIEILGTTGEYNAHSKTKGDLDGYLKGSKALWFGSINGEINGSLESKSKAHYEDDLLIKFTYDLDYEVEDYMLDDITLETILNSIK